MSTTPLTYGKLSSLFYDATEKYASEEEVDFYTSFMEHKQGRILEAMSGSGRLQIPLLQRGYIVDGVDNSPSMLDRCRQRCTELQLTPELYNQSLEELSLPHSYAMVTIAVGSFQLITDRTIVLLILKNIHAHMDKGGAILIDTFVPDTSIEPYSVDKVQINHNTVIRLTTRHVFYEQEKLADAFCFYELIVDGIVQQQENELIQVTWYTDDEFAQLLKQAGFAVIALYERSFPNTGLSRIVHAQALK